MKICGIISEYNPFHSGHKYQISKTREEKGADVIVSIMSGNFMQRGEPAIIDKWTRANMALSSGVDLVIELPVLYSLSSAEIFSFGAVSLLNALNSVDYISFGSEGGDAEPLKKISSFLSFEREDYKLKLREGLDKGLPFHTCREEALSFFLEEDLIPIMKSPNNILGIEYIKSLIKLKSNIEPFSIKRTGSSHNDDSISTSFSSASSIRKILKSKDSKEILSSNMPKGSYEILKDLINSDYDFTFSDNMLPFIKYKTYSDIKVLKNIPEGGEGLDYKLLKEINSSNFNDLVLSIKSKRYTYTRINRLLTQFFIGFENFDILEMRKNPCPYARILGFNDKGKEALKIFKKSSSIPLINKIPRDICKTLELDILSTKAYSLINKNVNFDDDFKIKPVINMNLI